MKKTRNSNIEILRIVAMFIIILAHYSTMGVGDPLSVCAEGTFQYYFLTHCWFNLGTVLFILIFGYFNINNKLTLNKVLKMEMNVWTYSVLLFAVALLMGAEFSIRELIKNALPVIYNRWWFVSAYMIMLIFSPYINKMIFSITQKQFLRLILAMLMIWSVFPMVFKSNLYGNELVHFLMLYFIGAYLRLYVKPDARVKRAGIWGLIGCSVLLAAGCVLAVAVLKIDSAFLRRRSSIFVVGMGACALMIAMSAKPFENKLINKAAGATFGIYLIHMHPNLGYFIWTALKVRTYAGTSLLIPHVLLTILIIFTVCALIDMIKGSTINRILNRIIDRVIAHYQPKQKIEAGQVGLK